MAIINLKLKPIFSEEQESKPKRFDISLNDDYQTNNNGGLGCLFGFHTWEFKSNGFKNYEICGCGVYKPL